jgi:hypothetical protein
VVAVRLGNISLSGKEENDNLISAGFDLHKRIEARNNVLNIMMQLTRQQHLLKISQLQDSILEILQRPQILQYQPPHTTL